MKNSFINKLTIIIEATHCKSISKEVLESIKKFEKSISTQTGLRLTLATKNDPSHSSNQLYIDDRNRTHNLSPENWDYWPV